MGTWGYGPFDNDDAGDWCAQWDETDDQTAFLTRTLQAAVSPGDYPDETPGSGLTSTPTEPGSGLTSTPLDHDEVSRHLEGIAAAAVLAAQVGGPALDPDHAIGPFTPVQVVATPELRALAVQALRIVMQPDSELYQLWETAAQPAWFHEEVQALIDALTPDTDAAPRQPHPPRG